MNTPPSPICTTMKGIEMFKAMRQQRRHDRRADDMLELAWGIIANATDWDRDDRAEWRAAAERWRDRYHEMLGGGT